MFHVSWCKACQRTFPFFSAAADAVAGTDVPVSFAHVECTDDKTLCQKYEVHGYPTIKLFFAEADRPPQNFRGQRTVEGFTKYAQRMTSPAVQKLSRGQLDEALQTEGYSALLVEERRVVEFSPVARSWMDRHLIAAAPSLAELLPEGIAVPEGAVLAVLSPPRQQWAGAGSASPGVAFYSGNLGESASDWIAQHRFPGIWALGESNFYEFTHSNKSAVLVAVAEVTAALEAEIRGAARLEDFFFGVLNGSHWAEELKVFNIQPEELPRVLVAENNFEFWVEDVHELRAEHLLEDLRQMPSRQLLRQGRTFVAKMMFYKREAWRLTQRVQEYAHRGQKEMAQVVGGFVAALALVLGSTLALVGACRALLEEPEVELRSQGKKKQ